MAHQRVDVGLLRARRQHEPGRRLVIGLVAQVLDQRQLLRTHLRGDLLEHLRARRLIGQLADHDLAAFDLVARAQPERAGARLVDLRDVGRARDQLAARREVGALDDPRELTRRRVGLVEQLDQRLDDLAEVVRRNVRRHADRDPACRVEQQVRHLRRQQRGLVQRAVEVRHPVDGALAELGEQRLRVARQPGLGVAHGRERLRVVLRAPVADAVDDRIAVRERLRHVDHGLVAREIAVRMELAEHVADRARGLLGLGSRAEAQIAHGVHDAPLHGLEPVADVRQRAVENHVHRVVEIGVLGKRRHRHLLDALEIQFLISHLSSPVNASDKPLSRLFMNAAAHGGSSRARPLAGA